LGSHESLHYRSMVLQNLIGTTLVALQSMQHD
jgi:hypothetical protein